MIVDMLRGINPFVGFLLASSTLVRPQKAKRLYDLIEAFEDSLGDVVREPKLRYLLVQ